jgi:competence ComEA-like helix-hairpin-helix protein
MAKISLRSYYHEIEGLIDKGQTEEAVAHCRHILLSFPKLLAAYRLMGKALLETRQYSDAADLFQRVLSSTPDDFVSQVGMSIIREDSGTLDAAIWHMERAFEVQPYNVAIQDELRRLYGRRDGVEPPKVRLTRGALARMYAKGNLYQQAIAELRAGLLDEATRVDLQVVLARMYFLSRQRIEAVDTCSALLKKLPYCLEANRILSIILPETGRKADAQVYLQRVQELDPYMIHADPEAVTSEAVPENIMMIERLDYQKNDTSAGRSSQPAWAASLGVNLNEFSPKQEEAVPYWLASIQQKVAADSKKDEAPKPEQTPAEESKTISPFIFEESLPEPINHPADKQAEAIEPPTLVGQSTIDGQLDKTEISSQASSTDETELPAWLSDLESTTQPADSQPSGEILPDWMKEAGWVTVTNETIAEQVSDTSDTLATQGQPGEEIAKADLPDWLKAMAPEGALEENVTPMEEKVTFGEEEQPVAIPMSAPLEESVPGVNLEDQDAALAWLEGLAANQGAAEAELTTRPEERRETPPSWVQEGVFAESKTEAPVQAEGDTMPAAGLPQELVSAAQTVEPRAAEAQIEAPSEISETDLPDWLKELSDQSVTARQMEEPAGYEKPGEPAELPDWLLSIDSGSTISSAPSPEEVSIKQDQAAPSLEGEPFAETPSETGPRTMKVWEEQGAVEIPVSAPLEESVPGVNLNDQDAAMAWLESLAAKQGAAEEELTTRPEARLETPPTWVEEITEKTIPAAPTPEVEAQIEQLAEPPTQIEAASTAEIGTTIEETPKPIEPTITEGQAEQPAQVSGGELPDWLQEISMEGQPSDLPQKAPSLEAPETAGLPDWLQEIGVEEERIDQGELKTAAEPFVENVPPQSEEAQLQPQAALSDEDAAMAWLESLAAKQGVPEEELTTRPEERPEGPPAWVKLEEGIDATQTVVAEPEPVVEEQPAVEELPGAPAEPAPLSEKPPVEEEVPLPDWLAEMAAAGETPSTPETTHIEAEVSLEAPEIAPAHLVNINTASLVELESLPGMGFILAQAIINHREKHGALSQVDDLAAVEGFTPGIVAEIRNKITAEHPATKGTETAPEVKGLASEEEYAAELMKARNAMVASNVERTLTYYEQLIKQEQLLPEVIRDLHEALYRYPVDATIWTTLGDAYMRNNQLQEALDAYVKAEELIR